MNSHDPRTGRQALLDEARCVAEEVDDVLASAQHMLAETNSDAKAGCLGSLFQVVPLPGVGVIAESWFHRTRRPKVLAMVAGQVRSASDVLDSYFKELGGEGQMPSEVCGLQVIRDRFTDVLQTDLLRHQRHWQGASHWLAEVRQEVQDEWTALVEHRQASGPD